MRSFNLRWLCGLPAIMLIGSLLIQSNVRAAEAEQEALTPQRLKLDPSMVHKEGEYGNPEALVDEQTKVGEPPSGAPETLWTVPSHDYGKAFPLKAYIDLGEEKALSDIWFYDINDMGDVIISVGEPGRWKQVATYDLPKFKQWVKVPLNVQTRYVQLTRVDHKSNFTEILLYAYTPEAWKAVEAKKAEQAKAQAEKEAAIAKAKEEAANRPVIDLGDPYGKVTLVDEIDLGSDNPGHMFREDPPNVSHVETILGRKARVLSKTPGEAALMEFRVGQYKLLKPGGTYILEVEYPEDAPRSIIVRNGGNESSRGFYTGASVGDALHPRYVINNNESLQVPLSGKYQTWRTYFNLHDHFGKDGYPRNSGLRALTPADGFPVTIIQFSADNIPLGHGAAVSRIRLYEVTDPAKINVKLNLPPDGLPKRHLFWREEMADGLIEGKNPEDRGVTNQLDWWRYKANLMQFLGMHTYTKDLLEFGAIQHWSSAAGGGNDWAYFNAAQDFWPGIVKIMGERGFDILPYYEYAGSKGAHGLGQQRRAEPLTRTDGKFVKQNWINSANADITDPDTYADFEKFLKYTILVHKDDAKFTGAWIRSRAQLPMGFGDKTRARFAKEANDGKEVTRQQLIDDKALLAKYEQWWFGKRKQFFVAMRDYLRDNGIKDASILYTSSRNEPGPTFLNWDNNLVTDNVEGWKKLLAASDNPADKKIVLYSLADVLNQNLYLDALLKANLTWGGWEEQYATPQPDPRDYKDTDGVLFTESFNRMFTVDDPRTFDAFRVPGGLAIVRKYSLNENMFYGKDGKSKVGYDVADMEYAGPYCMMGEALAMANGDPTYIGYLTGSAFERGFARYARNFNAAFLSLPALPSKVVKDASSDAKVVVRSIATPKNGTYLAIVNTAMTDKDNVMVTLPPGKVTDAATGEALESSNGKVTLNLYPYQLRALHVSGAE